MKKKTKIIFLGALLALGLLAAGVLAISYFENRNDDEQYINPLTGKVDWDRVPIEKPVIYLYPEKQQDINVQIEQTITKLVSTYPRYENKGWNVTASPDGSLINKKDGKPYSYLFWEGENNVSFDSFSKGFVVKGSDAIEFLQEKLSSIGLTPKEYNEFIVYWAPILEKNEYNLVTFVGKEYDESAKLFIHPKPDSMLRVFMATKKIEKSIEIQPQSFEKFERKGFTVVEWGGTEIK